jgi:hypothetical protein
MAILHTHIPKSKKRKPTAKQRELAASWEAMLKKYPTKSVPKSVTVPKQTSYHRETPRYPSLNSGLGNATKPIQGKVYTGSAMIGIGTLHKSNAVPIFSTEDAVEISKMRRG